MSALVFASVLLAAALHASWNALIKGGDDKILTMILVATSAAVAAAVFLAFLDAPLAPSWPYIAASVAIHVAYFTLVGLAYRVGDMGQTYPLMRGTAPFLVALGSIFAIGETPSAAGWAGVLLICTGIVTMVIEGKRGERLGIYLALLNAVVIASYTLIDGIGSRLSGSPAAYAAWVFMLTGVPLAAWVIFAAGAAMADTITAGWKSGLIGGTATVLSYAIVLHAMTLAPVAMVAALREMSILFGTLIAGLILRERIGPARMIGAGLIGLGAIALRLA